MKVSYTKTCLLLLVAALLQGGLMFGQEPFSAEGIPPGSDYVYRQHYDQVQEILKTPDVAEREAKLTAFYQKLHEDAQIRQYMESFFGQIVEAYQAAGQNAKAQALSEKMAEWWPESKDRQLPQQFQQAYEAKNYAQAIDLGEQLLQKNPGDAPTMDMLLQSYMATDQSAEVAELAPKLIDQVGAEKGINYVVWLANYHNQQGNNQQAARYYQMALDAYPSGRPDGWDRERWNNVKASSYQVRASQAWSNEQFQQVVDSYSKLLELDPQNAGAYLFIGLSHWRMQNLEEAQAYLARAVVLGGPTADRARQYLEQLYKPLNGGTLEGLDQLLDQARSDLNL